MKSHPHPSRRYKLNRLAVLVSLAIPLIAHADPDADNPDENIQKVHVRADKLGTTTEGTGSYTTRQDTTAVPLSLSLRETPQSVSIVTLQRIEDQRMQTVTDVVNNTVGISVNQYETNRGGFTSRGFDIDNLQIDGVPTIYEQSWSAGEVASSLALYDRVDVVRGATGLMTGAGNPSASINLVRKHANSKTVTGTLEAGISRWNGRRLLGDVTTPLNESGSVRGRVVGEYTSGDSWVKALNNKSHTVYATIDADLDASTLLQVGASHQSARQQSPMWGGLPYWYNDGSKTDYDVSQTTSAPWSRWPTSYNSYFANLEHTFENGWKVRASWNRGDRIGDSFLLYLSGTPDRITGTGLSAFPGSYHTDTKQDTYALNLAGTFDLAGRTHDASFGYVDQRQDFQSLNRAAVFATNVDPYTVANFNTWGDGSDYPTPSWGALTFYERSKTTQKAVYGVARFSLADPLKLILGARVTNYEKSGVGLYTAAYDLKNDHEVTPYAGLVYDFSRDYSAYVSYTSIFQPQNLKDFGGTYLDPVKGKSYEAGIKGEFLNGRLNGSFGVFQVKQDNLGQAAGMIDRDGSGGPLLPESYYVGAKGAKSEGFEFELTGDIAKGWNASAGYTQFRAKDVSGAEINSIYPRRLLRLFTTYRLPDVWSALVLGGGVNFEGRTYTIDPGAPAITNGLVEQKGFALFNMMARYEITHQLSTQLNIDNAFDKKHFAMFSAYNQITYGAPRSIALTLRYQY